MVVKLIKTIVIQLNWGDEQYKSNTQCRLLALIFLLFLIGGFHPFIYYLLLLVVIKTIFYACFFLIIDINLYVDAQIARITLIITVVSAIIKM